MPLSFILLGISIIYLIFYNDVIKYKNILIFLLILMLIGYFAPLIDILDGALFNFFIFVPAFILNIYFIVKLNKIEGLIFLGCIILTLTIYILMVINNMELSTLFSSIYIFLITLFFAILQSFNLNLSLAYTISSFVMFDILNIVLIKKSAGVVTVFSVESFSMVVYVVFVSIIVNKLFVCLKSKRKTKEKESNV